MKPHPCLSGHPDLEAKAQLAEQRKRQAIDRLCCLLDEKGKPDSFLTAMRDLIDADRRVVLRERSQ